MNNFGWVLLLLLFLIVIPVELYFIFKNGIKKTDFTKEKLMNFRIENGGIALILLLTHIFFGIYLYLKYI
ncbi:MAG: hypothetical protein GY932_00005 [Arcobacter sp.]|nr:hypothetical protein [Arcobacter sp.]